MIGSLFSLALGLFVLATLGRETVKSLRNRPHLVRVPGTYVATRDARGEMGQSPKIHKRAAYVQFTTVDGRVVVAESNIQTFPGPKVGRGCTVLYHPDAPEDAETVGRARIKWLFLFPIGAALGCLALYFGLSSFPF